MANKVLGIEISQNLTRVVEMDFKTKNPKIYNMFSFATPPDMLNDGGVEVNSLFGAMLQSKLRELHISTNKVIFVLNSTRIANREVELPHVKDSRIKDLLMANASDYFPVDLTQYELVHEVIGRVEEGDEKKIRLSVLAVPNDLIRAYELLAKSCGLTLAGLDYTGNAIKQLMIKEIPGEIKATLKVDEAIAILTIMEGEDIKLQRILNYGIGEAIEIIQDSGVYGDYLSFTEAMDVARRRTVVNMRFDESAEENQIPEGADEAEQEKIRSLKSNVTYSMQTLIGSIARVLDYYQSRNSDKTIDKIFLVGMGADFSGLSKLMSNELNYKVVALQTYGGIVLHKNINLGSVVVPEFFTCVGSLIAPLPIVSADKKLRLRKKTDETADGEPSDSLSGAFAIFGVLVAAAVVLAGISIIGNMRADSENRALKQKVQQYEYAEKLYEEYQAISSKKAWLDNLNMNTTTHNNNLVAFITEFEKKMPTQARVIAFVAEKDAVSFTIKVNKKAAVADVISKLRTFESIQVGELSTIEEDENEAGIIEVSFAIGATYVDQNSTESDTSAEEGSSEGAEAQTTESTQE